MKSQLRLKGTEVMKNRWKRSVEVDICASLFAISVMKDFPIQVEIEMLKSEVKLKYKYSNRS